MEPKKVKKGSIILGILINLISIVLIILLTTIELYFDIKNKYSLHSVGFICANIVLFFIYLKSFFIFHDGLMTHKAKAKGEKESGEIISLWVDKKIFFAKNYYTYNVRYHYMDHNGFKYEKVEKLTFDEYEALHRSQMVPLLIYNDRAIINKNSFVTNLK